MRKVNSKADINLSTNCPSLLYYYESQNRELGICICTGKPCLSHYSVASPGNIIMKYASLLTNTHKKSVKENPQKTAIGFDLNENGVLSAMLIQPVYRLPAPSPSPLLPTLRRVIRRLFMLTTSNLVTKARGTPSLACRFPGALPGCVQYKWQVINAGERLISPSRAKTS